MPAFSPLTIGSLASRYRAGTLTPLQLVDALGDRLHAEDTHAVWIHRLPRERLVEYARALAGRDPASLPLYGVPFAVKDNIDLAGVPTTAGCPDFAYVPQSSATVVQRLIDAGAIPVGKTNLDQFATGLVGTRSPYGACRNGFDARYVSGGSSSGSAVAVATGLAAFSLGTDTAGSGRVPAAFNNLVGHKPTRGVLSARGVVPACRSLDTISVFALTAADAARVMDVACAFDEEDAFSRRAEPSPAEWGKGFRFGVPTRECLEFFGNDDYRELFGRAVETLTALGGVAVPVDIRPMLEAARLLYDGPWVAERYAAIRAFFDSHEASLHPVTREIIGRSRSWRASDAYDALYRLMTLRREADRTWEAVDVVVTPTAGTIYTIDDVDADPLRLNANLGHYTNFMNLLDYAATAVPTGFTPAGLPFGVTLFAPAHTDTSLLHLASRVQRASGGTLGATGAAAEPDDLALPERPSGGVVHVAVCGAHMSGLPLNVQLTSRGGRLVEKTRSASCYRFHALPGGPPERPGMVRVAKDGVAVELEVWAMPVREYGSFVAGIPAPLGIGTVLLEDGRGVQGFVCEAVAAAGARDISEYGGWRAYLAAQAS
ncbi:MAG: allophanate hydrolase [Betaproteobacteria bacterium]|nr:allophanate hydrolase [Betaproteobacteria bacterium]